MICDLSNVAVAPLKPLWRKLFTSYLKGLCQLESTSRTEGKVQDWMFFFSISKIQPWHTDLQSDRPFIYLFEAINSTGFNSQVMYGWVHADILQFLEWVGDFWEHNHDVWSHLPDFNSSVLMLVKDATHHPATPPLNSFTLKRPPSSPKWEQLVPRLTT